MVEILKRFDLQGGLMEKWLRWIFEGQIPGMKEDEPKESTDH